MDIIHTLTVIHDKCGSFDALPSQMDAIVNKGDLHAVLMEQYAVNEEVVNAFLNLIYDEVYLYLTPYRTKRTEKT